ncbi:MAG: lysine exporter LysO family protein [Bacteroidales bacterium]|nr:lysine exporter LysO family protein [Bacteroidales bacterium]
MKDSIVILLFFIAGTVLGALGLNPSGLELSKVSGVVLCALMFLVGFSSGHNKQLLTQFKSLNVRILLLPLTTILGTFAGCLVCALLFREISLKDLLAIGSGMGYYSLSSVLIGQSRGAQMGTLALLSNIIREVCALLLAPLFKRFFGPLSPIAAGGATTADTTLPVIRNVCGQTYSIVSVYHGLVVDFCVPFLVSFFCSI